MTEEHAFQLIIGALKTLKGSVMLKKNKAVTNDTVLLGIGSPLDSIGFVMFVTELEEQISEETKKDLYLVLDEINEFNINKPQLTAGALAKYIVKLSGGD